MASTEPVVAAVGDLMEVRQLAVAQFVRDPPRLLQPGVVVTFALRGGQRGKGVCGEGRPVRQAGRQRGQ